VTCPSDHPAHRMLREYAASVLAKDLEAFIALYDRDLFVFDAWDVMWSEGIDAWRSMANDWFTSLGAERVVVEFEHERSGLSASLSYASAIVRFTAVSSTGESLRSLQNRMTVVLELRGNAWKVVHQHTSSPIDFDTKKAILEAR
jgi:ketosteroid isomerase-like protein